MGAAAVLETAAETPPTVEYLSVRHVQMQSRPGSILMPSCLNRISIERRLTQEVGHEGLREVIVSGQVSHVRT